MIQLALCTERCERGTMRKRSGAERTKSSRASWVRRATRATGQAGRQDRRSRITSRVAPAHDCNRGPTASRPVPSRPVLFPPVPFYGTGKGTDGQTDRQCRTDRWFADRALAERTVPTYLLRCDCTVGSSGSWTSGTAHDIHSSTGSCSSADPGRPGSEPVPYCVRMAWASEPAIHTHAAAGTYYVRAYRIR